MTEFIYIKNMDVLIEVEMLGIRESSVEGFATMYSVHRPITPRERFEIESYLLSWLRDRTDYFSALHSILLYRGHDRNLKITPGIQRQIDRHYNIENNENDEMEQVVNAVIHSGLRDFFAQKLGEEILAFRHSFTGEYPAGNVRRFRTRVKELIDGYNANSQDKITVQSCIPEELQWVFLK